MGAITVVIFLIEQARREAWFLGSVRAVWAFLWSVLWSVLPH